MAQFQDAENLLAKIFGDFEKERRQREFDAAKADPVKHAMTRVLDGHTGYTFFPVSIDPRGKRVRRRVSICHATNKNAAGNYLIWREVETYRGKRHIKTERLDWKYAGTKKEARALAQKWAERLKAPKTYTGMDGRQHATPDSSGQSSVESATKIAREVG